MADYYPAPSFSADTVEAVDLLVTDDATVTGTLTVPEINLTATPGANGAAPDLAFGDGDTGFWESADDTLHIGTAGTSRMNISVAGVLITSVSGRYIAATYPGAAVSLTAVTDAITQVGTYLPFTATAPLVLTSAPTIANGADGEIVLLINVGANAVTLSDQGTLPASNLRLEAATIELAARQSIMLMFIQSVGDWVQIGGKVAVI